MVETHKGSSMEFQLKRFFTVLLLFPFATQAMANPLEEWIRKLSKAPKYLTLTSTREETPVFKITPMIMSFKGVVRIPNYMILKSGAPKISGSAGQLIIDAQVICNYSPRSTKDRYYVLQSCSDGTRGGDEIDVRNKLEVKLNSAGSVKSSLFVNVAVIRSDAVGYGINFPYLQAEEGQVLMFNGEAWIPANISDLDIATGAKGDKGDQGEAGVAGPQGLVGPAGSQGAAGEKGDKGEAGVAGTQGLKGDAGSAGAQGPAGAIGPIGPQGQQGPKGETGSTGALGPAGAAGLTGAQGLKGETGAQGPAGLAGTVGQIGPQGERGLKGDKGATGDRGETGATGPQGPVGASGLMGMPGVAGASGEIGPIGPQGTPGAQGPKGEDGEKGERGLSEIAYLRDERVSGQNGGSCVGNTWNPRALNVLGGDTSFISLASNRFTLQPGKYFIEISAPAYATAAHQAKLKVINNGADALIGSAGFSHPASQSITHSNISGELIISVASTFEVQHRCGQEKLFTGLGQATSFGTTEIYTQVKIIKKQ